MQLKWVDTEEVIASGADKHAAEVKCSGILNDRTIYVSALLSNKTDIVGQLTIEIHRLLGYPFKDRLFLQVAIGNFIYRRYIFICRVTKQSFVYQRDISPRAFGWTA
jgi:hypothetical protein